MSLHTSMKKDAEIMYSDIDWPALWKQARARKSWKSKGSKEWNKKAPEFSNRIKESGYVQKFLEHLDLNRDISVLDVGCGPGTLALPLAKRVKRVTALDYSVGMLEQLRAQADQQRITNIRAVECAWEDDWQELDIGTHDIVIASRSMNIDDLLGGIQKINDHAIKQVFISDRIDPSPFDPDAFEALGRSFNSGPDYIYTVNMLYSLGIHPKIDHIELADKLRFDDLKQALHSYTWMFKDLQPEEVQRLEAFLLGKIIKKEDDHIIVKRNHPQRWALLSWMKNDSPHAKGN